MEQQNAAVFVVAVAMFTLILADFRQHDMADVAKAHQNCIAEHQPEPEIFKKYLHMEFEPNSENGCYIKCLLEKLDLFDPKDGFLKHNIMTQMTTRNPKILEPLMKSYGRCAQLNPRNGNDTCVWVARSFDCFMRMNREAVLQSFGNDKQLR